MDPALDAAYEDAILFVGDRKKQEKTTSLLSVDVDMTGQRENHGTIVPHHTTEYPIVVGFLPSQPILSSLIS